MYSLYFPRRSPVHDKQLLKKDLFGEVWRLSGGEELTIVRDARPARWWLSWIAKALLQRESRALSALKGLGGVPQLMQSDRSTLQRDYIAGVPLFDGQARHADFYKNAARLLRRIHRRGVTHNDLAKEPNILVCDDGSPAIIDFQLAMISRRRGRLFRMAAREDIRHLLKHKRSYRPDLLTVRETTILNSPSLPSRMWMSLAKPVYLFVTRRLLHWSDREGAADRGRQD